MKPISQEKINIVRANLHLSDEEIAKEAELKEATVAKLRKQIEDEKPTPVGKLDTVGRAVSLTTAQSVMNDNIRKQSAAKSTTAGTIMDGISVIDPKKPIR